MRAMVVSRHALVAAALLVAALPSLTHGLFEDEVGQYEWMLQQIGRPTALAYSAEASDRIFVASASGVVASVTLRDGTMNWRRATANGGNVRILRSGTRAVLSVLESGLVQAWKGSSGELTWQRSYADRVLDVLLLGAGSKQVAVVVRESEAEARTLAGKAELQWSSLSSAAGAQARFWAGARSDKKDDSICLLAAGSDGSSPAALELEGSTGKVVKKVELPAGLQAGLKSGSYEVVDTHLVVLVDGAISAYPLCGGDAAGEPFEMDKKLKSQGSFRLLPWQRSPGVFAVSDGETTAIFGVGSGGVKHLRTFQGVAVVGPVISAHDDENAQPVAVAVVREEGTQIQLLDPASGNVQPPISAKGYTAAEHGDARLLLVHELSSGEHRALISAADHSLAGIQGTKVSWVREEALASISQAVFYTRSASATSQERASRASTEEQGAMAQLALLGSRLAELAAAPMEIASFLTKWLTPARRKDSAKPLPGVKVPISSEEMRDFGASKLILAVTRAGKLFALEATTSEIVWQKNLGRPRAVRSVAGVDCALASAGNSSEMAGCLPWIQLLPSASAVHSELLVVLPTQGDVPAKLLWIQPLEGKVVHQENVPGGADVLSVAPLTQRGAQSSTDVIPVVLFDSKERAHALPSTSAEAKQILHEHADQIFHYEVDGAARAVRGFVVGPSGSKMVRLWNLEMGSMGEQILASASPVHSEFDHVPVHIKGDASILYKYINKNMIAVATETVRGNTTSLNLYALDAVTGHVLQLTHVPGGAGPVHLAVCDNWVAMHYHNPKKTRYEILVVEFFQAKSDDGPWDILFGGKAFNQSKSAHHLETPVPLQQTYIFPAGVSAMGVTATRKGITPRSLVMALTTEQVFRISKDTLLNPRRPHAAGAGALKDDKERMPAQFAPTKDEPLVPYAAMVPLRPTDVLSYYNPLSQVRGIASSPTALESTSLVFCYGLDLFFTPVQTAKAYDVLSPSFNYVLLYCSVGVMVIAWAATSVLAKRRALQDRWK